MITHTAELETPEPLQDPLAKLLMLFKSLRERSGVAISAFGTEALR